MALTRCLGEPSKHLSFSKRSSSNPSHETKGDKSNCRHGRNRETHLPMQATTVRYRNTLVGL